MVPLPLVKLIGLGVKQFISKPVASFLKSQVKTNPFLRNRVCIPLGRFHHNNQERLQRVSTLRTGTRLPLRPIDDETAMEQGADLIGELSIYAIAVLVLISEGIKWSNKASEKEAADSLASARASQTQEEHDQLLRDVVALKNELETLQKQVRRDGNSEIRPKCRYSDKH